MIRYTLTLLAVVAAISLSTVEGRIKVRGFLDDKRFERQCQIALRQCKAQRPGPAHVIPDSFGISEISDDLQDLNEKVAYVSEDSGFFRNMVDELVNANVDSDQDLLENLNGLSLRLNGIGDITDESAVLSEVSGFFLDLQTKATDVLALLPGGEVGAQLIITIIILLAGIIISVLSIIIGLVSGLLTLVGFIAFLISRVTFIAFAIAVAGLLFGILVLLFGVVCIPIPLVCRPLPSSAYFSEDSKQCAAELMECQYDTAITGLNAFLENAPL